MILDTIKDSNTSLRFAADLAPPEWDFGSSDIEVWRDNGGQECAYGLVASGYPWMRVVGIGDFRLEPGAGASVVPAAGVLPADVIDIYYRAVLPIALQLRGFEALHASAVVLPQGVTALCARSETGKSTLAYGLRKRGHPLFADDSLIVEFDGRRPSLVQVPFAVRLRRQSAAYFKAPSRRETRITEAAGRTEPVDLPIASICILERLPDECSQVRPEVEAMRLTPSEAFAAVLPHAYCFTLRDPDRKALMIKQYMSLVASVPVLRVRFRTGLEYLPQILDRLERSVAEIFTVEAA